jgi:hypothetical protein
MVIHESSQVPFSGITLNCDYKMSSIPWPIVSTIYECYIENDLFITHPQMPISDASGNHLSWKNNLKVAGFYARSAEVSYFPNNLEKIFPNLQLIAIAMCGLRVIRQQNLRPFDQLKYLCLFDNEIEVIEKHLFAHNLMLEAIDLRENRIMKININVFDYLINLQILYLSDAFNSSCVTTDASDRTAVVKLIQDIKEDCNEKSIMQINLGLKIVAKSSLASENVMNMTSSNADDDYDDEAGSCGCNSSSFVVLILIIIVTIICQ